MAGDGEDDFRVKLEFRKVLGQVSDGLSRHHVEELKNLCYDYVSGRKKDEIETGVQLFNALIEKSFCSILQNSGEANGSAAVGGQLLDRNDWDYEDALSGKSRSYRFDIEPNGKYVSEGMISHDSVQLLCELLEEIGRKDLSDHVQTYLHKRNSQTLGPSTVVDKLEFRHLKAISEEVGRDWKMLGRYLGLDEPTLESIHQAHFSDLKEASYQALKRWQMNSPEASPQALKQALVEMRLLAIVHKYFSKI